MTTDLDNLGELKCPLCGKMLTSNEFELANEELKARNLSVEERKNLLIQIREEERKKHQVEIEELNRRHNENSRKISDELKTLYKDQIEAIKKSYNELSMRKSDDFNEKTSEYEQQLRNKDRELLKLYDSMNYFKIQATADAKASIQNEIDERDEQIKRLKDKTDELGKQLSKTQSELKGETGETNLLRKLEDAFRRYNDILTPQIRGNSGADIVHQIRATSGELLCTKIGYDNKEASSVTAKDIEKAKRDKKALETDYFIVVSKNLPKKEAKNGLCGEKEGIVLAHPDIVTELATIIRSAIIEISKQSACKQDLQTKQVEIYDLIRSREFRRHIESINEAHKKLTDLQKQERKDHETLWKKENAILEDLVNSYNSISTGIDIILDKQDSRIQPDEKTENVKKESRENDEGSFSE